MVKEEHVERVATAGKEVMVDFQKTLVKDVVGHISRSGSKIGMTSVQSQSAMHMATAKTT